MINAKNLIKFEFIIVLLIVIFTLIQIPRLVSLSFYTSFVVLLILILLTRQIRSYTQVLTISIFIISTFCIIINAAIYNVIPSFDNLIFFLVFMALLIYMSVLQKVNITYSLFNWIMNWGMLFSACFTLAYYLFGIKTMQAGFLTMNFSNSNLLGMWLLQSTIFAFLNIIYQKKYIKKMICIVLVFTSINLLVLSGTRNAVIALILGAVIIIIQMIKKAKYSKLFLFLVAIFPIMFLIIYMNMSSLINHNQFLLQFFGENKGLDTRYAIWASTLKNLSGHYLIGSYFNLAGNTHNSHLVVLASYGGIVLILTIIYLYKIMINANSKCETYFQKICLTAFFVTIFMGIGEGSLFSGALGLYIPSCIYLLLCKYKPVDVKQ